MCLGLLTAATVQHTSDQAGAVRMNTELRVPDQDAEQTTTDYYISRSVPTTY